MYHLLSTNDNLVGKRKKDEDKLPSILLTCKMQEHVRGQQSQEIVLDMNQTVGTIRDMNQTVGIHNKIQLQEIQILGLKMGWLAWGTLSSSLHLQQCLREL
ncbi:hypothetical protein ACJX0J_005677 [Zea mays]